MQNKKIIPMTVTAVQLAGARSPGEKMPKTTALISRMPDSGYINVDIMQTGSVKTHHVQADCREDLALMAECLAFHLDGGDTNGCRKYERILNLFIN